MKQDDKREEMERYDRRARSALDDRAPAAREFGAAAIAETLRAPYLAFEAIVGESVRPGDRVLELAAGSGLHTAALVRTGARVTATDISPSSLELLARDVAPFVSGALETRVADMESLPFEDGSFDVVTCAGGLSYGDAEAVDREVRRVLRPDGRFLCVDSLNHNPVYRLNRWLQFRRGARTRSTIERMPDSARIASIAAHYDDVTVRYFGSATWAMPLVGRMLGEAAAARLSDRLDGWVGVRRSAFKFVLTARGPRPD